MKVLPIKPKIFVILEVLVIAGILSVGDLNRTVHAGEEQDSLLNRTDEIVKDVIQLNRESNLPRTECPQTKLNRLRALPKSMWGRLYSDWNRLNSKYSSILDMNRLDIVPPHLLLDAVSQTSNNPESWDYGAPEGLADLRQKLASLASRWLKREINPSSEICVTSGATEGIYASLGALIQRGDRVVVIDPAYELLTHAALAHGGEIVRVPLEIKNGKEEQAGAWAFDWTRMRKALENAEFLVLNNPMNIPGKLFTQNDLENLATIIRDNPKVIVISDEVYYHMTYDGLDHRFFSSLPGMFDRTISILSGGKVFGTHGHRVGWAIGPSQYIERLVNYKSMVTFSTGSGVQMALAKTVEKLLLTDTSTYLNDLKKSLQNNRDHLIEGLEKQGLATVKPQGTPFLLLNINGLKIPDQDLGLIRKSLEITEENKAQYPSDYLISMWLYYKMGIRTAPSSLFLDEKSDAKRYVRVSFASEINIKQMLQRLKKELNHTSIRSNL